MSPTRVRTLVIIAAVSAIVAWLLLRQVYSVLPPLPWTGVPALLLLAVAEAWSGRSLRARLRGRGRPVPPIAVARMAALAKATSLAAALVGGLAAGFLLYVASSLDKAAYRGDAYASAGTFVASVVLVLAALYLEYGCRVPTTGDAPGQPPDG
jgi:DMSO reductase anchor subunit